MGGMWETVTAGGHYSVDSRDYCSGAVRVETRMQSVVTWSKHGPLA
jgi:hypothetical protein